MVMHMKKIFTIAIATVALLMGACQQSKPGQGKPGDQSNTLPPLHLGAVHQVYPDQGFALLRIIGPMPKGGTVLISHPADGSNTRVGNLVVLSGYIDEGAAFGNPEANRALSFFVYVVLKSHDIRSSR